MSDRAAEARTALPAATAALRAVLDLHRRATDIHEPDDFCAECSSFHRTVWWPCPTMKAISAALTSHQHPTPLGSSGKCDHEARGVTWAEGDTTCYVCETCEHEWTEE